MRNFAFPTIAIGLMAALLAAYFVHEAGSAESEGTTWRNNGMTVGEDIQLLDSGNYISRPWCDICVQRSFKGRWSHSGSLFTLTPEDPAKRSMTFRRITKRGCTILVPSENVDATGDFNPFSAYVRKGDKCINRLFEPDPSFVENGCKSSSKTSAKPDSHRHAEHGGVLQCAHHAD